MSDQALKLLNAYSFPGNIRELKNILERSVLLCDGKTIKPCHLSIDLASVSQNNERQVDALGRTFKPDEEIGVLLSLGLTKRQIAMKLGVSERTVYRILRSLQ